MQTSSADRQRGFSVEQQIVLEAEARVPLDPLTRCSGAYSDAPLCGSVHDVSV